MIILKYFGERSCEHKKQLEIYHYYKLLLLILHILILVTEQSYTVNSVNKHEH